MFGEKLKSGEQRSPAKVKALGPKTGAVTGHPASLIMITIEEIPTTGQGTVRKHCNLVLPTSMAGVSGAPGLGVSRAVADPVCQGSGKAKQPNPKTDPNLAFNHPRTLNLD